MTGVLTLEVRFWPSSPGIPMFRPVPFRFPLSDRIWGEMDGSSIMTDIIIIMDVEQMRIHVGMDEIAGLLVRRERRGFG